jgi:uncharacterized protein (TIGR03435 family)
MEMGPKGRKMTGKVSIARMADVLANLMDRPVIDMTGLSGTFDIELNWAPDASEPNRFMKELGPGPNPEPAHAESSDNPSIFVALQEQLGLRLEAKKSPVEILVIDHIEKVPTEN